VISVALFFLVAFPLVGYLSRRRRRNDREMVDKLEDDGSNPAPVIQVHPPRPLPHHEFILYTRRQCWKLIFVAVVPVFVCLSLTLQAWRPAVTSGLNSDLSNRLMQATHSLMASASFPAQVASPAQVATVDGKSRPIYSVYFHAIADVQEFCFDQESSENCIKAKQNHSDVVAAALGIESPDRTPQFMDKRATQSSAIRADGRLQDSLAQLSHMEAPTLMKVPGAMIEAWRKCNNTNRGMHRLSTSVCADARDALISDLEQTVTEANAATH